MVSPIPTGISTIQGELTYLNRELKVPSMWDFLSQYQRVTIKGFGESIICTREWDIRQLLPRWIPALFTFLSSEKRMQENENTIQYFYKTFGRQRVERISKEHNLDLEYLRNTRVGLHVRQVEILLTGLLDVRVEEVQSLFNRLKGRPDNCFRLSQKEIKDFADGFDGKSFDSLTHEDYAELYRVLIPFADPKEIFLTRPVPKGRNLEADGSFSGYQHALYELETMRRRVITDHWHQGIGISPQEQWDTDVMKGGVYAFLQEGTLVVCPEGAYYIFYKLEQGGAYKVFLKGLQKEYNPRQQSRIVYLGTDPKNWQSVWKNDMYEDVGSHGIEVTLPDTERILRGEIGYGTPQPFSFLENHQEEIALVGFSLGGGQAARDALWMAANRWQVRKITLICNISLDRPTVDWVHTHQHTLYDRLQSRRLHVVFIHQADDATRLVGDNHLGFATDPKYIDVTFHMLHGTKEKKEERVLERMDTVVDRRWVLFEAGKNLAGPHVEPLFADPNEELTVDTLSNQRRGDIALLDRALDASVLSPEMDWTSNSPSALRPSFINALKLKNIEEESEEHRALLSLFNEVVGNWNSWLSLQQSALENALLLSSLSYLMQERARIDKQSLKKLQGVFASTVRPIVDLIRGGTSEWKSVVRAALSTVLEGAQEYEEAEKEVLYFAINAAFQTVSHSLSNRALSTRDTLKVALSHSLSETFPEDSPEEMHKQKKILSRLIDEMPPLFAEELENPDATLGLIALLRKAFSEEVQKLVGQRKLKKEHEKVLDLLLTKLDEYFPSWRKGSFSLNERLAVFLTHQFYMTPQEILGTLTEVEKNQVLSGLAHIAKSLEKEAFVKVLPKEAFFYACARFAKEKEFHAFVNGEEAPKEHMYEGAIRGYVDELSSTIPHGKTWEYMRRLMIGLPPERQGHQGVDFLAKATGLPWQAD